jgi:L-2-hydroxyglutarate oxidase LhgO
MAAPGSFDTDIAVIGAGVVGLACAAALARRGHAVIALERGGDARRETSARNSGVIHAGLAHPAGSLKTELCIEGRIALYERCAARGIPHRKTGKLIVASAPDELAALEAIHAQGAANDLVGLRLLEAREVSALEPRVRVVAGLLVPETGIVDAHQLVASYQAELESAGGRVVLRTAVCGLSRDACGWRVDAIEADGARTALRARCVVNAAGLEAERIAGLAGIDLDAAGYRLRPNKGDYFAVAPRLGCLTERLVYPVPHGDGGLGVHVTVDLGGRFRLGPDAEYVERVSYEVDPAKAQAFADAVRRYLPEIRPEHLSPDGAGVRPKLQGSGEPFRDFAIAEESARGLPGLVNLVGIESPGLTAAGAIAERVAGLV